MSCFFFAWPLESTYWFEFYCRSPSKLAKKSKTFKFVSSKSKEKREKSRDKEKSEKESKERDKKLEKESKEREKKIEKDREKKVEKEKDRDKKSDKDRDSDSKDKKKDKKDKHKEKKDKKIKQTNNTIELIELGGNWIWFKMNVIAWNKLCEQHSSGMFFTSNHLFVQTYTDKLSLAMIKMWHSQ